MSSNIVVAVLGLLILAPLSMAAAGQGKDGPVRHIVVFKYKPEANPEQIRQVTEAFRDLRKKISGITGFEDGVNNSPERLNKDFTHVYLMTFESVAARDAYLPHPEHKKFGELLRTLDIVADVFVVDYVVR